MKFFNIYENDGTKEVIAVGKGFNWLAFFFNWIYSFVKEWSALGAILLSISFVYSTLLDIVYGLSEELPLYGDDVYFVLMFILSTAYLVMCVFIGLKFNEHYEKFLLKKGFKLKQENVLAQNKDMAEFSYRNEKETQ